MGILILSNGAAGAVNQCRGLARALSRRVGFELEELEVEVEACEDVDSGESVAMAAHGMAHWGWTTTTTREYFPGFAKKDVAVVLEMMAVLQ